LRKAVKKLRYATEFLSGLYRRKAAKTFLGPCKELQTLLGVVNDAVATPSLAEGLGQPGHPELAPAIGALARWSEDRSAAAGRRVTKVWHAFRATNPFWE
ncbi:MAG: CHAD domain-containing protein, partial [Pseudomonadota bacterium]|nr:CHAD domain-containing protein [Pseudomonadota bacterium]